MTTTMSMPGLFEWLVIALIGLVMFALPVVLLVVLLVRSRTARRWFVGMAAGVFLVMLVGLGLLFGMRGRVFVHSRPTVSITPDGVHVEVEPSVGRPGTSVTISGRRSGKPSISVRSGGDRDVPFEPDVYASKGSAVRAVARLLAEQYKERITPAGKQRPRMVIVSGHFGEAIEIDAGGGTAYELPDLLKRVAAQEVSNVLGGGQRLAPLYTATPSSQPDAGFLVANAAVNLYIDVLRESGKEEHSNETGLLTATLTGSLGQYIREVAFVNKPWSEDFDRWRKTHGGSDWVEGESDRLCASEAEARAQAMADATDRVIGVIITRLDASGRREAGLRARRGELNLWLGQIVPSWLEAGQFQADTFTQKYERPYGTLYRCAVLVHVPPAKADTLLDAFFKHDRAYRVSWIRGVLSAAGLLGLIVVVYLFLNAATRGYYVWSVRIAAVVLAVVGLWCVMMLA